MKKSSKPDLRKIKPRQRLLSRHQLQSILNFLSSEELPEHDYPFKLFFNSKLTGSANPSYTKSNNQDNENI